MKLPAFHFYVAVPPREGSPATGLQKVSIAGFDIGCFPDEALCDEAARRLAWRDGQPVAGVETERAAGEQRTARVPPQERRDAAQSGTHAPPTDGPARPPTILRREPI
jgi:hypothetical protein